jgi:hypothetical protein
LRSRETSFAIRRTCRFDHDMCVRAAHAEGADTCNATVGVWPVGGRRENANGCFVPSDMRIWIFKVLLAASGRCWPGVLPLRSKGHLRYLSGRSQSVNRSRPNASSNCTSGCGGDTFPAMGVKPRSEIGLSMHCSTAGFRDRAKRMPAEAIRRRLHC